ncbi:MAG: radical SAM protein [Alphaproteobacteria bacterium]|nr:radical SAM protein [Alphaproteobacteria bacterium]
MDSLDRSDDRVGVDYIHSVPLSDIERILADEFGDRFRRYRVAYRRSLNYPLHDELPPFPLTVSLELVNRCNLKCIMCYTEHHREAKSTLALGTIEKVLAECRTNDVPAMVIGMGSEALLYKNVREVVAKARQAGVMDIFFGTNATLLDEAMSEFLVEQRVARIEISLDAATRETYARIRSKDELERVEANVRKLVEVKRRHGAKLPVVRLCFCVQPENLAEKDAFLAKWRDWVDYVDFQERVDFRHVTPLIKGEVDKLPPAEALPVKNTYCDYPFNSLHVWASGEVTPCCTYYGRALVLGNVKQQTLAEIWQGEKIAAIRRELKTGKLNPTCRICLGSFDHGSFEQAKTASDPA